MLGLAKKFFSDKTAILNLALLISWAWVHLGVFGWLFTTLTLVDNQLNLILAMALGLLVAYRTPWRRAWRRLQQPLCARPAPVAMLVLGALGLSICRMWMPLNPLLYGFATLGAYGLLGLFLAPRKWRQGRLVVGLGLCLIPSAGYLDVYLGFPARMSTAHTVSFLLAGLDIAHIQSGTVLLTEGRAATVDLPCSGMHALWAGAIFLLVAATIERRTLDRWFGVIALFLVGLLWLANTARVAVIVVLDTVADLPLAAEIVHGPLGLIGFGICCALAWLGLMLSPRPIAAAAIPGPIRVVPAGWIVCMLVVLSLGLSPRSPIPEPPAQTIQLPPGTEQLSLTMQEQQFSSQMGGSTVRGHFSHGDLTGEIILVSSRSWRAQHLPRQCLEAAGLAVEEEHPVWLGGGPVRQALVTSPDGQGTALWWFQSVDRSTDDYTERIWAGIRDDAPWMMVSVLLEGNTTNNTPDLDALVRDLRVHVASNLEST